MDSLGIAGVLREKKHTILGARRLFWRCRQDARALLGRSASQAAQECEDILACTLRPDSAGASPAPAAGQREPDQAPPSARGAAAAAPTAEDPEEPQQPRRRRTDMDMEDLGGDPHSRPAGPHYGRSAVWDGGTAAAQEAPRAQRALLFADVPGPAQEAGAAATQAAATPGRGMGVFEGTSHVDDDDVDWGALGTLRKGTPAAERARQIRRRSLPVAMALDDLVQPPGLQSPDQAPAAEGGSHQQQDGEMRDVRGIRQTDGAADDSCSDVEEEPDQAAPSNSAPPRGASQRTGGRVCSGGASQGSGSQRRYAALPSARACGSSASAPAAPQRREPSGWALLDFPESRQCLQSLHVLCGQCMHAMERASSCSHKLAAWLCRGADRAQERSQPVPEAGGQEAAAAAGRQGQEAQCGAAGPAGVEALRAVQARRAAASSCRRYRHCSRTLPPTTPPRRATACPGCQRGCQRARREHRR